MNELTFRDILENFLKENNLTQTAFAEAISVKQSQVSEWLKGKAKPSYDILKQMSKALDIPANYWLGLTQEY